MKGFSLIEIILSVALITIIFSMGSVLLASVNNQNELGLAINYFKNSLTQAQIRSIAVEGDSAWGVKVHDGLITLFRGNSFDNRDEEFDNVFDYSNIIKFSGDDEYVFSRLDGFLANNQSTTFSNGQDQGKIEVNIFGVTEN